MANRCKIEISMSVTDIPDLTERQQYLALHDAQIQWREKFPDSAPFGEEYEKFLASQSNSANDVYATFGDKNGELWVQPEKLRYNFSKFQSTNVPMNWWFRHDFPDWAQVGFANGEKTCGRMTHIDSDERGWLIWELEVSEILNNLKYAIEVHEKFPISNQLWEWQGLYQGLHYLEQIYIWFCKVNKISSNAVATLDWSEVATNIMNYDSIKKNNEPNVIMDGVKRMAKHTKQLNSGKLSVEDFRDIYADKSGFYIPIAEREPFGIEGMLI